MARLFLSVMLPTGIRNKISGVYSDFGGVVSGNWVAEGNIHISLKFLDEVTGGRLLEIKNVLSAIKFDSFNCEILGVGGFPTNKFPRVLWVGASTGAKELADLSEKIDSSLHRLGFSKGKGFSPHATFCRIKQVTDRSGLMKLFDNYEAKKFGDFKVSSFQLMQSKLSRGGATYSVEEEFSF